jgi:hypothetical protein
MPAKMGPDRDEAKRGGKSATYIKKSAHGGFYVLFKCETEDLLCADAWGRGTNGLLQPVTRVDRAIVGIMLGPRSSQPPEVVPTFASLESVRPDVPE